MYKQLFISMCVAGVSWSSSMAHAQLSGNAQVYASGLNNPRGLAFDPADEVLYVAEAGLGGSSSTVGQCAQAPPPLGPFTAGNTARITGIDNAGNTFTLVDGLPSSQTQFGDVLGPTDMEFVGSDLHVLVAAGCSKGVSGFPNAVARVTPAGGVQLLADLSAFNLANPQNFPPDDDQDPEGNPYSFKATTGGDLIVVEANHSTIERVSASGAITRVADMAALTQVYDTPVAIDIDSAGNIYIGSYSEFPFASGAARIYKLTPSGAISVHAQGLTTIVDIAFDEQDRLYVLETSTGNTGQYPFLIPSSGQVTRIKQNDKHKVLITGLDAPTAMTFGPDGALYVSNRGHSMGLAPGQGEIIRFAAED